MLELKGITKNEKGQIQECFTTNSKRIKQVKFTYAGTEKDLDNFLTSLISTYAKKHKIID